VVANPRRAAGSTVVSDWLRLFRWPRLPRGHDHEANRLRIFIPALDLGSHINASLQLLPEVGAQRTLEAVSCKALFG
jgi:hypothetical protein